MYLVIGVISVLRSFCRSFGLHVCIGVFGWV